MRSAEEIAMGCSRIVNYINHAVARVRDYPVSVVFVHAGNHKQISNDNTYYSTYFGDHGPKNISFIGLGPRVSTIAFKASIYCERGSVAFENVAIRLPECLWALQVNRYCNLILRNCDIYTPSPILVRPGASLEVDNCRFYYVTALGHTIHTAFIVNPYAKSLTVTNSVFSNFSVVVKISSYVYGDRLDGDKPVSVKVTDNMFKVNVGQCFKNPFLEGAGMGLKNSGRCV